MQFRSLLLVPALLAGSAHVLCAQSASPTTKPTLVVVLTIDQMRGDYLDRYATQYTGGLARLRSGTVFTRAMHDHGITETAPGHASILSGRFPVNTNIASNSDGVGDRNAPLIGATGTGASPLRFQGTTLVDWMRAADSSTRWLSVSRKDRSAILPIGRSKGDVFWYSANGTFTQSSYYATSLPLWVQQYNSRRQPARYAGWTWTLLLPDSAYAEPDSVVVENSGRRFIFPHVIPDDSTAAMSSVQSYPVMDELTLDFALTGINQLQLGADRNRTDIVAISLSSTDAVGHRWGPDSRELHDQLLRVDRYLGAFFDSLFTIRDSTRVIVSLTADHGVTPFPAVQSTAIRNMGAGFVDVRTSWRALMSTLHTTGIDTSQLDFDGNVIEVHDTTSFVRANVSVDSMLRAFAVQLRTVKGVHRVDMLRDLARVDTTTDAIARRWLHSFRIGSAVRMVVTHDRFHYQVGDRQAMHGSPWDEDAWVTLALWGAPFRPGRVDRPVRVVDLAPTLARALNVRVLERVDGVVLSDVLR